MAAESGGDSRAGIGSRLRAARERKGLTILQAAEKVHTDPRVLEALEAEDFASLGAAVYARGHLRHYAELVGESPAELQELYTHSTRAAPAQPDLTRISRAPRENESTKLAGPAMTAIVAIALLGTLWYFMTSPSQKSPQPTAVDSEVSSSNASSVNASGAGAAGEGGVPGQVGGEAVDGAPAAAAGGGSSVSTSPKAAGNSRAASNASGSAVVPRAVSNGATAAGTPKTAGTTPAAAPGAKPTPTAATVAAAPGTPASAALSPTSSTSRGKQGELTLKFSSDSWAEVYDASGQRLFYDVGAASSAHTVKGPAPMRVVLGNASGVALEYNGRPAPISSGLLPDGSARFVINAHGRAVPVNDGD